MINRLCINCGYDKSRHAYTRLEYFLACPADSSGTAFYDYVGFVPVKNNLEYLERKLRNKEEHEIIR